MTHHRADTWADASERDRWHALFSMLVAMEERLMTVSAEVQAVLDDARQNKSLVQSIDLGMKALQQQVTDLQNQINNQSPSLSDDDKAALAEAADDLSSSISTLQADIPANTNTGSSGGSGGATTASSQVAAPVAPFGSPNAPTGSPGSPEAATANGPANHPAGGSAPLQPTAAFDPDPVGTSSAALSGQPSSTVATAGGFVVGPKSPAPSDPNAPAISAGAPVVAPTSTVPNVDGGVTVLAGQAAPGAPISTTGGVESAVDAGGVPLSGAGAAGGVPPVVQPGTAPAPGAEEMAQAHADQVAQEQANAEQQRQAAQNQTAPPVSSSPGAIPGIPPASPPPNPNPAPALSSASPVSGV
jgi:hypothetical protein